MPDEFVTTEPVRGADEVVVGQPAGVGVELAAGLEGDRVESALGIGQLDPVADLERSAPRDARSASGSDAGHLARILCSTTSGESTVGVRTAALGANPAAW